MQTLTSPGFAPPGAAIGTGRQGVTAFYPTLDVMVIDAHGALHLHWRDPAGSLWPGWQDAALSVPGAYVPGGQLVSARHEDPSTPKSGRFEMLAVDVTGAVTAWTLNDTYEPGIWAQEPRLSPANFALPGKGIAVGAHGASAVDVFVVDATGQLQVATAVALAPYAAFAPITASPAHSFKPGSSLATGVRYVAEGARPDENELDLFAVDANGVLTLSTLRGDGARGWTAPRALFEGDSTRTIAGTGGSLAAAHESPGVLDVLFAGHDAIEGYTSTLQGDWRGFQAP